MITPAGDPTREEVLQAERDWVEVYLKNDAEAFDHYLTEDFVYTSPVCEVVERATYLKNLREHVVEMKSVVPSDIRVQLYGETAVVTGRWVVEESYRGTSFSGPCRITRVWVKVEGRWRAAAFHVTECHQPAQ